MLLTSTATDLSMLELTISDICLRLLCAMLIGAVNGIERE